MTEIRGPKIPRSVPDKLAARVMYWDDERAQGNSLIITLRYGWHFPQVECHTIGVDTVKEAVAELRRSIPCACEECERHKQV